MSRGKSFWRWPQGGVPVPECSNDPRLLELLTTRIVSGREAIELANSIQMGAEGKKGFFLPAQEVYLLS